MSSSAATKPNLIPHPVRTAASSIPKDAVINARFRTFDPGDKLNPYKWLAGARVNLVRSDQGPALLGVTDSLGILYDASNPSVSLIVNNVQNLPEGVVFHFEVLGPASAPSSDLTSMTYSDGPSSKSFPVPKWSTEGWQEPEKHFGHFRLSSGTTPALRSFTVGCYIDVPLKFVRGSNLKAPFPENIELKLVTTTTVPVATTTMELYVQPGGRLTAAVFNVNPGATVEVKGFLNARAIIGEKITTVSSTLKVDTLNCPSVAGERFGLGKLEKISSIELYKVQAAIDYPETISGPAQRLVYKTYSVNLECTYQELSRPQKICVCFNWFLEFIAYRNLFVRTLNYLLAPALKINWTGLLPLTLQLDDGEGSAAASGLGQIIIAHLEFILKPRDDTCIHEMAHAFDNQYWSNPSAQIYFPAITTEHSIRSYSNEIFAFQEGFAQFMASLFMNPSEAYFLQSTADWRNLFSYQTPSPGPYDVTFGNTEDAVTAQEPGIGLAIEGAFSASLGNLWAYKFWSNRTTQLGNEKCWVQDPVGDGTLDIVSAAPPNRWLLDADLMKKFANIIFDSIAEASQPNASGLVAGMTSTRRVIDQIEKRTPNPQWPTITWQTIAPLFDRFKVVNDFYISSVTDQGAAEYLIVRSTKSAFEYAAVDRPASQTKKIVIYKAVSNTLTLRGIRFPATLSCSLVAHAGSPNPNLPIVGAVTRASEYEAEVLFTTGQLSPVAAGPCDLLFETDLGQPANQKFLVTSVEVQA
jgi:hypothetical protein